MTGPAGELAGAEAGLTASRRRNQVLLAVGLLGVVAFLLFLGFHHRATMRLLAEKTAEADRKEQELQDLEQQLAAAGQQTEASGQKAEEAASELAQVLEDNQVQQRRLSELLGRIGPALEEGVELTTMQLGRERLSLVGCAASQQVVDRLVASLAEVAYLEREPPKDAASPESPCADNPLKQSFDLQWKIRAGG